MKIKKIKILFLCGTQFCLQSMEHATQLPSILNPTVQNITFKIGTNFGGKTNGPAPLESIIPEQIALVIDKERVKSENTMVDTDKIFFHLKIKENDQKVVGGDYVTFEKNILNINKETDNVSLSKVGINVPLTIPLPNKKRKVKFIKSNTFSIIDAQSSHLHTAAHNTDINNFGTIDNFFFSGSLWPSIKKTSITQPIVTLPFINNAFLLACRENGMVIAKIDEKDNGWFWLYRRFGIPYKCNVTLYALFFNEKRIKNFSPKIIDALLEQAKQQYDTTFEQAEKEYKKQAKQSDNTARPTDTPTEAGTAYDLKIATYSLCIPQMGGITIITLARNVQLDENILKDPERWPLRAAVGKNSAIVVHTRKSSVRDLKSDIDNINPDVSFAFTDAQDKWVINSMHLAKFLGQETMVHNKKVKHPYLNEIKSIYLYKKEEPAYALIVTRTQDLGYAADGIYKIPLHTIPTRHSSLVWHLPIQSNKKNEWSTKETIIANTFNYEKNILYFVTKSRNEPIQFTLYTYEVNSPITTVSSETNT